MLGAVLVLVGGLKKRWGGLKGAPKGKEQLFFFCLSQGI